MFNTIEVLKKTLTDFHQQFRDHYKLDPDQNKDLFLIFCMDQLMQMTANTAENSDEKIRVRVTKLEKQDMERPDMLHG